MGGSIDLVDHLYFSCLGAYDDASNNKVVSSPSCDLVIIGYELQGRTNLGTYKHIQEAFSFMDASVPSIMMTDKDVQHWLGKTTARESNSLLKVCGSWRIQHPHPGLLTIHTHEQGPGP